jgi:hypothetical protein
LPLADDFSHLDDGRARALGVTLGFESGLAPGRLSLADAATLLLRQASARAPLPLIIDDLPWLDRAGAGIMCCCPSRRLRRRQAGRQQGTPYGGPV